MLDGGYRGPRTDVVVILFQCRRRIEYESRDNDSNDDFQTVEDKDGKEAVIDPGSTPIERFRICFNIRCGLNDEKDCLCNDDDQDGRFGSRMKEEIAKPVPKDILWTKNPKTLAS
jgi:hypothetical protein